MARRPLVHPRMLLRLEARDLTDRCTIKRVESVEDGRGGWTEGEVDFATDIPCRVDRANSADEMVLADRLGSQELFTVSLSVVAGRWPGGVVDVRASDRLIVTGKAAGVDEPVGAGGPVTEEYLRILRCKRVE